MSATGPRYFRHSGLEGVECLRLKGEGTSFPRHTHECFVIGVSRAIPHAFDYRGQVYRVTPDAVALLNPGEPHTGDRMGASWDYRGLHVSAELLTCIWRESGPRPASPEPHFSAPLVRDPSLADAVSRLHRRLATPAEALDVESRTVTVLSRLLARHGSGRLRAQAATRPEVGRACEMLAATVRTPPTLSALAAEVGLSRFHFLRVFRRQTGLTPYAWLAQLRVQRAKHLIRAGRALSDVAWELGFSDQSHLTRMFGRIVGLPPAAWRAAIGSKV